MYGRCVGAMDVDEKRRGTEGGKLGVFQHNCALEKEAKKQLLESKSTRNYRIFTEKSIIMCHLRHFRVIALTF